MRRTMKTKKIIAIAFLIASVILIIACLILLPDVVITQFSLGGDYTTMNKPIAIIIPSLLGVLGSLSIIVGKLDDKTANKSLIISGAGVFVFILMLIVNLIAL